MFLVFCFSVLYVRVFVLIILNTGLSDHVLRESLRTLQRMADCLQARTQLLRVRPGLRNGGNSKTAEVLVHRAPSEPSRTKLRHDQAQYHPGPPVAGAARDGRDLDASVSNNRPSDENGDSDNSDEIRVVLLGNQGSGKSTLVGVLCR